MPVYHNKEPMDHCMPFQVCVWDCILSTPRSLSTHSLPIQICSDEETNSSTSCTASGAELAQNDGKTTISLLSRRSLWLYLQFYVLQKMICACPILCFSYKNLIDDSYGNKLRFFQQM